MTPSFPRPASPKLLPQHFNPQPRPCPRHRSQSESHFTEEGSPISSRRLGLLPGFPGVRLCVCQLACLPIYLAVSRSPGLADRQATH
ncbi:hypothetical protein K456DRAFT_861431 [Colletotrichum gloeosporioides 23]|nr:hypothetical protein K456DRAFT_861431 [Colletotrichum gloeosporioides 23]